MKSKGKVVKTKVRAKLLGRVVADSWNGERIDKFIDAICKILIPVVKAEVHLCVPHNERVSLKKDGKFRILIWSSPLRSEGDVYIPPEMFNIPVSCRDVGYGPVDGGIPIMDGSYCVAALYDDQLYIHHDICHHGSANELQIFSRILQEVVGIVAEQNNPSPVRQLEAFTNVVTKTDRTKYKPVEPIERQLNSRWSVLQTLVNRARGLRDKNAEEATRLEIEKMCKIEGVKKVVVSGFDIHIYTSMLYCPHDVTHNIHKIGEFKITLHVDGSSDEYPDGYSSSDDNYVSWKNLSASKSESYTPEGYEFPHDTGGTACTGTAEGVLPKLIKQGEYTAAAIYAIKFIQSANVKDQAGRSLRHWPIYKTAAEVEHARGPIALAAPTKCEPCKLTEKQISRLVEASTGGDDLEERTADVQDEIVDLQRQWVRATRKGHKISKAEAKEVLLRIVLESQTQSILSNVYWLISL